MIRESGRSPTQGTALLLRRKAFEVTTGRTRLLFPYAKAAPRPASDDPVRNVYVDKELGREAFTYVLDSGKEGTVHIDHVLGD